MVAGNARSQRARTAGDVVRLACVAKLRFWPEPIDSLSGALETSRDFVW